MSASRGGLMRKWSKRLFPGIAAATPALLLCFAFALFSDVSYAASDGSNERAEEQRPEEKWGIEIESVRPTAGGRLVDFRYRITDAEKASAIFDRRNKAYLLDQASGVALPVPRTAKVGPLRQTNFRADPRRVYFILFSNPGVVKSGSLVTLVVGDVRFENITVQ